MTCKHLTQLYQLCKETHISLSSSDLIRIICKQCEREEVCPSMLLEDGKSNSDPEEDGEETPAASLEKSAIDPR